MSRSTRAVRTEEHDGTYWRFGHLYARREKSSTNGAVQIRGGTHGSNPAHVVETAPMSTTHANVMSDLLRAAVVDAGGQTCGGQTLYEMIWDELFTVTDRLIGMQDAGQEPDADDVGAARSLAWVIAMMRNPYLPNVDSVKEDVMDQWEKENRSVERAPASSVARSPRPRRARRVR
jgi:hypothetical protein